MITTRKDIVKELKRELGLRNKLYPEWIQKSKLHEDRAKKQLARIEAALYLLDNLTDGQYIKLLKMIEEKKAKLAKQSELFK